MSTLDTWAATVCAGLGLEPGTADVKTILDLARDVAHAVDRPAAPLTAYLAGVAVGRGLDPATVTSRIRALAASWPAINGLLRRSRSRGDEGARSFTHEPRGPRRKDGR